MINYVNSSKFNDDSIDKQITLTFSGGDVLTNTNLEQESFQLTESINSSEQLEFGSCEASELKFTVWGIFTSHVGQTVTVTLVLDGDTANPFTIGTYKVVEDVASADRTKRTMTCYDALYDILNADVAAWYNTLFPTNSTTKTIKQIRDSLMSNFGITQESVTLVNDSVSISKTIQPTSLSGKDVITAICQINGVFGHITRDNRFRYVSLTEMVEGLYPEDTLYPANDLYPQEDTGITPTGVNGNYISLDYSDYLVQNIDKVVIRQDDNDIGGIAGTGTNAFVAQGNFLMYGKNSTALNSIATTLLNKIKVVWYRPAETELRGNLCFEVGDGYKIESKYEGVFSYILSRTYKGIQAPRDLLIADGLETRNSQINSVNSELMQLKGKSASLRKDVDEVSATLTEQLDDTVVGSYAYQTAAEIGLKVSKSNIVSELNSHMGSGIYITYNNIDIVSDGSLTVNTSNFILDSNGNATFSGQLSAPTGIIGGFEITSDTLQTDPTLLVDNARGIYLHNGELYGDNRIAMAVGFASESDISSSPFKVYTAGGVACKQINVDEMIDVTDTLIKLRIYSNNATYATGAKWRKLSEVGANDFVIAATGF